MTKYHVIDVVVSILLTVHFVLQQTQVMVCTAAFGMGVDVPNVDMVVRIGCPPSVEELVQEFGRAGRDGRQAKGEVIVTIA